MRSSAPVKRSRTCVPAATVPKAVIVVVPVMLTNGPVAVLRSVVVADAISAPFACSALNPATDVVAPVPPFATVTVRRGRPLAVV